MTITYRDALALSRVDVPAHLAADADVPVLDGPQAQGDLLVLPWTDGGDQPEATLRRANRQDGFRAEHDPEPVPDAGVRVLRGGAHAHVLHRGFDSPGVTFTRVRPGRFAREAGLDDLTVGVVVVPEGQSAVLVHTDEHGANGIAPGAYLIKRKRELRGLRQWSIVED